MKTGASLKNRQGGAVAVMVGISIVLLVGFLAMVIDLGHLYIAKTGLQNAADAAALSGAKELNGTSAGVTSAKDRAIEAAGKNTFFGDVVGPNIGYQPVSVSEANITFSNSPYTPDPDWISFSAAQSVPGGLTFIKVDTGQQNLHTVFAVVWNIFNMSTYGRAVAGRLETPITPIGVCAIDPDHETQDVSSDGGDPKFRVNWGFQQGVSYGFDQINKLMQGLSSGALLYLHPTATSPETCEASEGNANFITPFLCTGRSAISGLKDSKVYANTGIAAQNAADAINTRFDDYGDTLDPSLNDYRVCAPDTNIMQYVSDTNMNVCKSGPKYTPYCTLATNWMNTQPRRQDAIPRLARWLADYNTVPESFTAISGDTEKSNQDSGCGGNCNNDYGVLWSYSRPTTTQPGPAEPSDWGRLYPSGPTAAGPYLASPTITCADPDPSHPSGSRIPLSPYCYGLDTKNSTYFHEPNPSHNGVRNRRILNVVIVNCPGKKLSGCDELTVLGAGRFFLQTRVGSSAEYFAEFAGMVPKSELQGYIRLYQ